MSLAAPLAEAKPPPFKPPTDLPATSWLLVDAKSGFVLAQRDAGLPVPVASATKLMTYYVASQKLRPGEDVTVGPYEPGALESVAGVTPGDTLTARDLYYGLLLPSGNDVANTLALRVSGSSTDFAARMNAAAARLGLDESSFADPIGLSSDDVSSARDLVDLTLELRDDPLFREIVDTPRAVLRSGAEPLRVENRNSLVLENDFVDGVKTGSTLDAGYVLVASARRGGVSVVSALTGAPSEDERDAASLRLLKYGLSQYGPEEVLKQGQTFEPVELESGRTVKVESGSSAKRPVRIGARIRYELAPDLPPDGPIAKGDPAGRVKVFADGVKVVSGPLFAAETLSAPEEEADADLPPLALFVLGGAIVVAIGLGIAAIVTSRRVDR